MFVTVLYVSVALHWEDKLGPYRHPRSMRSPVECVWKTIRRVSQVDAHLLKFISLIIFCSLHVGGFVYGEDWMLDCY